MKKLEAFATKFANPGKKPAYKTLHGMISVTVELHNMYHSYAKGCPSVVTKQEEGPDACVRKLGDAPPNWLLNLARIYTT